MSYLRQVWAIVAKDLTAELHTREITSAMFIFAILAMFIFSFALDLQREAARATAPGILWTTVAFAGTLGLSRGMAREQQNGSLEGLLLAPVNRSAIFFGKMLSNLTLMLVVEAVLLPLGTALFDVPFLKFTIVLLALLATTGYATAGTLLATIAVNTRAREVMLPLLLLPLTIPLFIATVQATGGLIDGMCLPEINHWIQLLVVYNLLSIAVAIATFDYLVEE